MPEPEMLHHIQVLKAFHQAGECQHGQRYRHNRRLEKAAHKTIDEYHHQEVARIRPYEIIVEVGGDQYFSNEQQDRKGEVPPVKTQFHGGKISKVLSHGRMPQVAFLCRNTYFYPYASYRKAIKL